MNTRPHLYISSSCLLVIGQRLFRRSGAGSDSHSETSSVAPEEPSREEDTAAANPSSPTSPALPEPPAGPVVAVEGTLQPPEPEPAQGEEDLGSEERHPEGQEDEDTGR